MKRILGMLLAVVLVISMLAGCASDNGGTVSGSDAAAENAEDTVTVNVYDDGRARPSSCGQLQVKDGKLCSEDGEPVMLRGLSTYGVYTAESFINEALFEEFSRDLGINVMRLALYTSGVGGVGYCTEDCDKERLKQDVFNGVEYAKMHDMYVIIDWHMLRDGDPNQYAEESKVFFAEMAEKYCDYNNVIYEICNEPNGVDWATVKKYCEEVIPVIREKDPDSVIIAGVPDWSKDLKAAQADPLEYDNILYTFHFYAASHYEDWRATVESCSQSGMPIFVTEYGVTASSGGLPRDLESADEWIELLEKENISHCMWSLGNHSEANAMIRFSTLKYSGFTEDDYTKTGLWFIEMMKKYTGK